MAIRVLIADDDALIRDSLKIVLDLDSEIEVVGHAKTEKRHTKCAAAGLLT